MNEDVEFYKSLVDFEVDGEIVPKGTIFKFRMHNWSQKLAVMDTATLTLSIPDEKKSLFRKIRGDSKEIPELIEQFKEHFEERRRKYFEEQS